MSSVPLIGQGDYAGAWLGTKWDSDLKELDLVEGRAKIVFDVSGTDHNVVHQLRKWLEEGILVAVAELRAPYTVNCQTYLSAREVEVLWDPMAVKVAEPTTIICAIASTAELEVKSEWLHELWHDSERVTVPPGAWITEKQEWPIQDAAGNLLSFRPNDDLAPGTFRVIDRCRGQVLKFEVLAHRDLYWEFRRRQRDDAMRAALISAVFQLLQIARDEHHGQGNRLEGRAALRWFEYRGFDVSEEALDPALIATSLHPLVPLSPESDEA